jgi:catalase
MHCRPDQGVKTMSLADAKRIAGEAPDYHSTDMWDAIERGDFPTWTFSVQVMTAEQAEQYRWNIFDDTKTWGHADFPLRPLGKFTLNRNVSPQASMFVDDQPGNHFAEVEQAAFSPSTMVPGIAPSADPSES